MKGILCIESAADVCSVALARENTMVDYEEVREKNAHSKYLTKIVEDLLKRNKTVAIEAVAISKGPGSYTGLRIGTSVAKGLCYGLNVPLVAISTLTICAHMVDQERVRENDVIIPMIDARRMEVYSAVIDHNFNELESPKPTILDELSFSEWLDKTQVHFVGNGAEKFKGVINSANAVFHDIEPSLTAKGMIIPACDAVEKESFEDLAYFEPSYLKPVAATKPKNKWF